MSSEDRYARSIAKLAVTQLLSSEGLDSAQKSTIDILADLLIRYITEIASQSHAYAELSHRTECSPTDIATALKNMGQSIPDLLNYAKRLDDTSFPQNIADFPLSKPIQPIISFSSSGEAPPEHIPAFLPAFPDPHTLIETAKFGHPKQTIHAKQKQVTEQQKLGEEVLVRVEAREHPEIETLQRAKDRLDDKKEEEKDESNPFLATVLWESTEEAPAPIFTATTNRHQQQQQQPSLDNPLTGDIVEWTEPLKEQVAGDTAAPITAVENFLLGPFDSFRLNSQGTRIGLVSSGKRVADAYGGVVEDVALAGGRRRQTVMADATRYKVREIITNRAEDTEGMYGGTDDMAIDREFI